MEVILMFVNRRAKEDLKLKRGLLVRVTIPEENFQFIGTILHCNKEYLMFRIVKILASHEMCQHKESDDIRSDRECHWIDYTVDDAGNVVDFDETAKMEPPFDPTTKTVLPKDLEKYEIVRCSFCSIPIYMKERAYGENIAFDYFTHKEHNCEGRQKHLREMLKRRSLGSFADEIRDTITNPDRIVPVGARIVIRPVDEKSRGVIQLQHRSREDIAVRGIVLNVGKYITTGPEKEPNIPIRPGDIVYYDRNGAIPFKLGDEKLEIADLNYIFFIDRGEEFDIPKFGITEQIKEVNIGPPAKELAKLKTDLGGCGK